MAILSFILKSIFFIIALIMFIPAKLAYIGGADQKTWVPAEATVLKSELGIRKTESQNEDEFKKLDTAFNSETYFWDVEYKYKVEGAEYTREGIYVNSKISNDEKNKHQQLVKKYPVDASLPIFVNPKDHSQAYVFRRTEGGIETWYNITRVIFYFSIFLFFIPVIGFIYKKIKGQRVDKSVVQQPASVQPAMRQNYSKPEVKHESTVQRSQKYSDDGFDV